MNLRAHRVGWGIVAQGQCGSKIDFHISPKKDWHILILVIPLMDTSIGSLFIKRLSCICHKCCSCSIGCSTRSSDEIF